jgi:hypothetical protein
VVLSLTYPNLCGLKGLVVIVLLLARKTVHVMNIFCWVIIVFFCILESYIMVCDSLYSTNGGIK